ncbi:hypothetical protein FPQ18DRAFT_308180 [Pyronema domesticum]|nr:hypothetical protein FPQ18DRAFT_308180 [Pyronema domesticum]
MVPVHLHRTRSLEVGLLVIRAASSCNARNFHGILETWENEALTKALKTIDDVRNRKGTIEDTQENSIRNRRRHMVINDNQPSLPHQAGSGKAANTFHFPHSKAARKHLDEAALSGPFRPVKVRESNPKEKQVCKSGVASKAGTTQAINKPTRLGQAPRL